MGQLIIKGPNFRIINLTIIHHETLRRIRTNMRKMSRSKEIKELTETDILICLHQVSLLLHRIVTTRVLFHRGT